MKNTLNTKNILTTKTSLETVIRQNPHLGIAGFRCCDPDERRRLLLAAPLVHWIVTVALRDLLVPTKRLNLRPGGYRHDSYGLKFLLEPFAPGGYISNGMFIAALLIDGRYPWARNDNPTNPNIWVGVRHDIVQRLRNRRFRLFVKNETPYIKTMPVISKEDEIKILWAEVNDILARVHHAVLAGDLEHGNQLLDSLDAPVFRIGFLSGKKASLDWSVGNQQVIDDALAAKGFISSMWRTSVRNEC